MTDSTSVYRTESSPGPPGYSSHPTSSTRDYLAIEVERRSRRAEMGKVTLSVLAAIGLLLVIWEIAALIANSVLFAGPWQTARATVTLLGGSAIYNALGISLEELYIGFLIGAGSGLVIGLLIGNWRAVDRQVRPYVNIGSAIPGIILIPLCVAWVGVDYKAELLLIILITIWPVLLNTSAGMENAGKQLAELGESLRLSQWHKFRHLLVPSSAPYILAGLRISIGLGMVGMIIGQLEVHSEGLGFLLGLFGGQLETAQALGVVAVTAVISLINVAVINGAGKLLMPWFLKK